MRLWEPGLALAWAWVLIPAPFLPQGTPKIARLPTLTLPTNTSERHFPPPRRGAQ